MCLNSVSYLMFLSVYLITYIILKVKLCFIITEISNYCYYLANRHMYFKFNIWPVHNWLICTKQILRLWRFIVHRKLNWCLFSTKLLNITRSGISGPACWDTLKQGLHEPCTICPRQKACQRLLSICDLSGQKHIWSSLYASIQSPILPGFSVPDSIHFLPISPHVYFMSFN